MTTILYLVRHGETAWNVEGRWQGHADVPLSTRGQQQARLVAEHLAAQNVTFDVIYSSDLSRAYQTAWEIGSAVRVAVQLLPSLREIDLGSWSGLTRSEVRARFPVEYALMEQGQDIPRGEAETEAALFKRVTETIEAMIAQHSGETLCLVTHGGPIRALLKYAHQKNPAAAAAHHDHIGNTAITVLHCEADHWRVVAYNTMEHLEQAATQTDLVSFPPDDAEGFEE
jgi:probable phosphoglycerate mutase